jgi:hypothetical protein
MVGDFLGNKSGSPLLVNIYINNRRIKDVSKQQNSRNGKGQKEYKEDHNWYYGRRLTA